MQKANVLRSPFYVARTGIAKGAFCLFVGKSAKFLKNPVMGFFSSNKQGAFYAK